MRRSQEEERERLGWRDQLEVFQKRSANHKPVILHQPITSQLYYIITPTPILCSSYITPTPILYSRSAALKAKIAAMDLTPRHNTPVMEEVRNIF